VVDKLRNKGSTGGMKYMISSIIIYLLFLKSTPLFSPFYVASVLLYFSLLIGGESRNYIKRGQRLSIVVISNFKFNNCHTNDDLELESKLCSPVS